MLLNNAQKPINILTTHLNYLVCGNYEGTIRFYDFNFKIVAWFEDCLLSNVKSISFSNTEPKKCSDEGFNLDENDKDNKEQIFRCSDFLVADDSAMIIKLQSNLFEEIEPAKKRGETIMHGIKSSISAIAVHPHKTKLAIAGADGFILIWDYIRKDDIKPNYQFFNQDKQDKQDFRFFTCMEFTPDGSEILVAVYTGDIKVMDADKGEFKTLNPPLKLSERHSKNYATQMIVTHDGKYFACCDNECSVLLFKKDHLNGDPTKEITWQFSGKIKSHEIGVSSIAFGQGLDENGNRMHKLFSIGKDRRLFEYDVYNSVGHDKLIVVGHFNIEQEALPTACIWYPKRDSKEGLLLTANNEYKMKVWNPSAQSSRATCLGPTYGGEITKMKQLTIPGLDEKYLVY